MSKCDSAPYTRKPRLRGVDMDSGGFSEIVSAAVLSESLVALPSALLGVASTAAAAEAAVAEVLSEVTAEVLSAAPVEDIIPALVFDASLALLDVLSDGTFPAPPSTMPWVPFACPCPPCDKLEVPVQLPLIMTCMAS
jgi:hypothetical protein